MLIEEISFKIRVMLELNVNAKSPGAITAAFKKIKEMITSGAIDNTVPVHIVLDSGVYHEVIKYNLSNPLVMEAAPGVPPETCVVQADNSEQFNRGVENRSVFVLGPNVTNVSLKHFSVVNTHTKTIEGDAPVSDSAEAFTFNNTTGTLFAEDMRFEGRQNTLCLKGFSWFLNCYISGDVDFIYGDIDTALFEDCRIHVIEDNRGDYPGYVVKSSAFANKKGFIFYNSTFVCEKRKHSKVYLARTLGKGSATSLKNWDSIAFINCVVSDLFSDELLWDDDMSLNVYPRGNFKNGVREYNTRVMDKNGNMEDADTSMRNVKTYLMTEDDYFKGYATRYLILHDTPFAEII